MRERECPVCGEEMYRTDDDPDTGIIGGWDCDCGHTEPLGDFGDDDP